MSDPGLAEYLILPSTSRETDECYKWSHNATLLFLDFYKEYRNKVGSLKIRNMKKMYEEISKELRHKYKADITPANCENRWKHLERTYKKYIDNNNKTGRARKDFEYVDIMEEILGKKRNINPVIILASDTIRTVKETENMTEPEIESNQITCSSREQHQNEEPIKVPSVTHTEVIRTPKRNKILKFDVLKAIRQDRMEYYKKHLEIEEKKLEEKVKKNRILEERNNLLKQYIEKQLVLPMIDLQNL